jgi:Predicted nucleic-acid-binding protein containing a Zn-ribbon
MGLQWPEEYGGGGAGILHLLDEVNPDDIKIGMKVKAVWRPADERTGSITDIKHFKPV